MYSIAHKPKLKVTLTFRDSLAVYTEGGAESDKESLLWHMALHMSTPANNSVYIREETGMERRED